MNQILRSALCATLAVLLLVGLCGCGKPKTPPSDPVYREDITDYCIITQETNSTYKVRVINPHQQTVFEQTNMTYPPELAVVSDGEIALFYNHRGDITRNWAVVCNPESGYVSNIVRGAYLLRGPYAVYAENLTNQLHIFVKDLRENGTHLEAFTLVDAHYSKPRILVTENKDGTVKASYDTNAGKKSVEIEVKIPE